TLLPASSHFLGLPCTSSRFLGFPCTSFVCLFVCLFAWICHRELSIKRPSPLLPLASPRNNLYSTQVVYLA
ncbi:hypothetical protein BDZ91DRAFT_755690, partial [Kalaharituber pfeilii]